jgi:hypothetical protein
MCGADALTRALAVQLQRHVGRHVKTLRRQIQGALDACDAELATLGPGRDTVDEMRVDLADLFSASKELVVPAVYGFYKNPPRRLFFRASADPRGTPAQNLRARATEENEKFALRVRAHGRKVAFWSDTDPVAVSAAAVAALGGGTNSTADGTVTNPITGVNGNTHTHANTHAKVNNGAPLTVHGSAGGGFGRGDGSDANNDREKQHFTHNEVEILLRQIRGSEFPLDAKPRAVYMLFQSYAENWPRLAQEHKDNVGAACSSFLAEVIDFTWPRRMHEPLRARFLDPTVRRLMANAQTELERLVQDLHLEVPPYDPEYEERLLRWRADKIREGGGYTEAQEVLEKMLIYYEVCYKI